MALAALVDEALKEASKKQKLCRENYSPLHQHFIISQQYYKSGALKSVWYVMVTRITTKVSENNQGRGLITTHTVRLHVDSW